MRERDGVRAFCDLLSTIIALDKITIADHEEREGRKLKCDVDGSLLRHMEMFVDAYGEKFGGC